MQTLRSPFGFSECALRIAEHAFELILGHRDGARVRPLAGGHRHAGDAAIVEGHAQLRGLLAAVRVVQRVHGWRRSVAGHPARARRHAPPFIDEALQDGESAFTAHLVLFAAEGRGQLEIAEIEAGKIDPIDGGNSGRGGQAIFGIGRIYRDIIAKGAAENGNRSKA